MSSKESQNVEEEIKQSSVIYFTNKLKSRFGLLKKYLYSSYIIIGVDIILMIIFYKVFLTAINICSLLIIILFNILCYFIFRHNFEIASYNIYKSTIKVIYFLIVIICVHYADMFYTLLFRILLNFNELFSYEDVSLGSTLAIIFGFFGYFIFNLSFPIVILFKLIEVKNGVRDLGLAQGESYDTIPSNDNGDTKRDNKLEMSQSNKI